MRPKLLLLSLLMFGTYYANGQSMIKVKRHDNVVDKHIQEIMDFESLFIEQLDFEGEGLRDKSYIVTLDEFDKGKKVRSSILFDGTEDEIFKIRENKATLKFFLKTADEKLKVSIRGSFFASRKMYFPLKMETDIYTVKDFFGEKEELLIPSDKVGILFAIITPAIRPDGSGTYCDVVQSDIKPEKWYEHFKIPHYFVIRIRFK